MAYTPNTWATGDTITAQKLNNMESGIASAGSALITTDTNGTLDKTFAEIYDALANGIPCYVKYSESAPDLDNTYVYTTVLAPVVKLHKYDNMYRVYVATAYIQTVGSYSGAGTPKLWSYSAVDSQSYPTFYTSVFVTEESADTDDNR